VGQGLLATLLAIHQVGNADSIVGAAAISTAFAQFTLGLRSHNQFLLWYKNPAQVRFGLLSSTNQPTVNLLTG